MRGRRRACRGDLSTRRRRKSLHVQSNCHRRERRDSNGTRENSIRLLTLNNGNRCGRSRSVTRRTRIIPVTLVIRARRAIGHRLRRCRSVGRKSTNLRCRLTPRRRVRRRHRYRNVNCVARRTPPVLSSYGAGKDNERW